MRQYGFRLVGLVASALLMPLSAGADGDKSFSANLQSGAAAITSDDDIKKVNEYSSIRTKNGVNPYGKVDLNVRQNGVVFDGNFSYLDSSDQDHNASLDVKRVFKTDFSYSALNHYLDHDRLQYLDAAVPPPTSYTGSAANPLPLTPNSVPAYWYTPKPGTTTPAYGGSSPTAPVGYSIQQIGRASVYGEDLTPNAVFAVKRTEWSSKSDLTIPQLPNVTFHFGYRNEDRNGMRQSIGMSKCTSCHVTGQSKNINENTRDVTAGLTGKFGLFSVFYSYLNREFRDHAATPTRYYDPAFSPGSTTYAFDNRLLYDYRDGLLRYDETPDSNKQSHVVKAKLDLPDATSIMGSYVRSTVDSAKTGETGIFNLNGGGSATLHTTYDAYGGKLTKRFGNDLTISLRGHTEKIRNDDVTIGFYTINGTANTATNNTFVLGNPIWATRSSALSRDTITAGADLVYRLALRTTLQLGYDYKLDDRHDEIGATTAHTVKASINTRPSNSFSARAAVDYQMIDNPYHNPNAALTNWTTNTLGTTVPTGATYGISLYDQRIADLTNQPDSVINSRLSATWTPSARYSITAMYTLKAEENNLNMSSWSQTTHGPGISLWYAPTDKVNMTLSYNYLHQKSGTAFCQGWYDG